jgi:hypothetical protein
MTKALRAVLAILVLALPLFAQSPGVTVSWEMLDGSGNPIPTAYLTFQLWNCSGQIAEVIGFPSAIVQQQFTMHANGAGLVSGSVFGNNQISCGNIQSTEWIVQQFKATNQPSGLPLYYCLNAPTTFNPTNAQPCQAPPPLRALILCGQTQY